MKSLGINQDVALGQDIGQAVSLPFVVASAAVAIVLASFIGDILKYKN